MKPVKSRITAASVRQKLLNLATSTGEDFGLVLTRYALERLLYRLSQSKYRDQFILKGAMLFQVWSRDQPEISICWAAANLRLSTVRKSSVNCAEFELRPHERFLRYLVPRTNISVPGPWQNRDEPSQSEEAQSKVRSNQPVVAPPKQHSETRQD